MIRSCINLSEGGFALAKSGVGGRIDVYIRMGGTGNSLGTEERVDECLVIDAHPDSGLI